MTLPSASRLSLGEGHAGGTIDPAVLQDIRKASQATQIDFSYLMAQAAQESGFQADAKAKSSSASGLYQFIDSTWLDMVRLHGAKYGIGDLAAQVTTDSAGRSVVPDAAVRARILDLRKDTRLSAAFAAEYAKSNQEAVERALGRPASSTDHYLAHFLGAGGATQLLKTNQRDGSIPAAAVLPEAADANRAAFYDARSGEPRTVAQLYRSFAARFEGEDSRIGANEAGDDGPPPFGAAAASTSFGNWSARIRDVQASGVFNAMMLAAIKLLAGRSDPVAAAPHSGASPAAQPEAQRRREA
jgi:hypothetical protein